MLIARSIGYHCKSQCSYGEYKLISSTTSTNVYNNKMIGSSTLMQKVWHQIEIAGNCDVPVLLIGETGTGKEIAAKNIHRLSNRREKTFLPVNLGAIPESLISSVLFGYEKGAFTGADRAQSGIFEQGYDGTVFLDEIGNIDYKAQIGLLRLLEEKKFNRLGGKKEISTNARIISASNENLDQKSKSGAFREDLYYRLDVFCIKIPPLKDRLTDIPELINYFLAKFNHAMQKQVKGVSGEVIQILQEYDWPGNVRELKNVIQRAIIVCEDEEINPLHLPPRFRDMGNINPVKNTVTFEIGTSLERVEKEMILKALSVSHNNRTHAAELLGISRRAIYNKLKKHDIQRSELLQ